MSNQVSSPPMRGSIADDLRAGFIVFLIALPLCLGISIASGFPPVAGVLTAIVGGLVVTPLGSARFTIKGPAAGLIVIAIGAVTELGQGDGTLGYRRALAVGVVAAVIQIVFALLKAASVGVAIAPSVVHGMLAAIGVIIVSKQSHTMMGVVPSAKGPLPLLAEIPHSLMNANPEIFLMGIVAIAVLIILPRLKLPGIRKVPPAIVALALTIPMGLWFDMEHVHHYHMLSHDYQIGPQFLVQLPASLLNAVTFPLFDVVWSPASLKYIVMFALIGTIESTLSALAADALDPERRRSNLNRDLLALGVGNLIASFIGGLPMISEIVRTKANLDAGAKTNKSNLFHGAFLLLFVAFAPGLLHEIPLAVLAAMLVFTGFRLASPTQFHHAKNIGIDQLIMFLVTLVTTLATDLLVGIAAGLTFKIGLHVYQGVPLKSLLKSRVTAERHGDVVTAKVEGAAIFSALLPLQRALGNVDQSITEVVIDLSGSSIADHTFLSRVDAMSREWPNARLVFKGLDEMKAASSHPLASRRRVAT
ncbi:MAG: SulP family inorganic anion transporter [Deltaproteobacteria bacterium]|nr:SulP family inorganic anion transporter [Deltaproteobacteria bacterium]